MSSAEGSSGVRLERKVQNACWSLKVVKEGVGLGRGCDVGLRGGGGAGSVAGG